MMSGDLFIGLDFGSGSVRALLVDRQGRELATAVHLYRRWNEKLYCNAAKLQFRQHPADYLEGMEAVICEVLRDQDRTKIAGIGVDTTSSTPCAIDRNGTPLALKTEFSNDPNAMFVLWKDHTAIAEEQRINECAANWSGTDFRKYSGGIYSCEWFWSKVLHLLRNNPRVRENAYSFIELCDWIPAVLSGNCAPERVCRSRCAAGHKAMWHKEWGGLPPEEFLIYVDPLLKGLRQRLYTKTVTVDCAAGKISPYWAAKLGLPETVTICSGAIDCHVGAIGAQIKEGELVKVLGTSTCDILVVPEPGRCISGICGQVDGSVLPGLTGIEAGQSAFGDIYNWFGSFLSYAGKVPLTDLERDAARLPIGANGVTALDWHNGRRTPFADSTLSGAISNLNLGTTVPMVYRALIESTVMGSKAILEHFKKENLHVNGITAVGGISHKSPFIMQMCADAFNMPIKVAKTAQSCALGAAMNAAAAAGFYPDVPTASQNMGGNYRAIYTPDKANHLKYEEVYQRYLELGKVMEQVK